MGVIVNHPQGVEFNETGTPTATPLGSLWWQRTAKKLCGADGNVWGNTILSPPVITSPTTSAGTVGTYFTYQITATNSPTSWNATGLPAGLSVNTSNGLISGIPSGAGVASITLSANNAAGTGTGPLALTVAAAILPPVITSPTTASGILSAYFSYQITATNSPTSFNATGLPSGLTVNTGSGLISGTLTTSGITVIGISATNSAGTGTGNVSLSVLAPPVITSSTSGSSTQGAYYSYQITATNPPITGWNAINLPPGLSINTSTGVIDGIPTTPQIYNITLYATNAAGTGNGPLQLTVAASAQPPVITSALSASGTQNAAFAYQITATNSPTSWNAASLPSGLMVNTGRGLINGAPTVVGNFNCPISATNAVGTDNKNLAISLIAPGPSAPTNLFFVSGTPVFGVSELHWDVFAPIWSVTAYYATNSQYGPWILHGTVSVMPINGWKYICLPWPLQNQGKWWTITVTDGTGTSPYATAIYLPH